jgi:hypothetical protein
MLATYSIDPLVTKLLFLTNGINHRSQNIFEQMTISPSAKVFFSCTDHPSTVIDVFFS